MYAAREEREGFVTFKELSLFADAGATGPEFSLAPKSSLAAEGAGELSPTGFTAATTGCQQKRGNRNMKRGNRHVMQSHDAIPTCDPTTPSHHAST